MGKSPIGISREMLRTAVGDHLLIPHLQRRHRVIRSFYVDMTYAIRSYLFKMKMSKLRPAPFKIRTEIQESIWNANITLSQLLKHERILHPATRNGNASLLLHLMRLKRKTNQ